MITVTSSSPEVEGDGVERQTKEEELEGGREGEREGGRALLASSLEFYVLLFSSNFIGKYKEYYAFNNVHFLI